MDHKSIPAESPVELNYSIFSCDCGARVLALGSCRTISTSQSTLRRFFKKLAKKNGLQFSATAERCPQCLQPKDTKGRREIHIDDSGIKRDEMIGALTPINT